MAAGGAFATRLRRGTSFRESLDRTAVVAALPLCGALVGVLLARNAALGFAVVLGVFYAPLVIRNLPLGIALWFPIVFFEYVPGFSRASEAAMVLILVTWLGILIRRRALPLGMTPASRRVLAVVALLFVWVLVSLAWGTNDEGALNDMSLWSQGVVLFLVVATGLSEGKHVQWIAAAFVAGAVISVVIGLLGSDLHQETTALQSATHQEGRLQGGAGDPNLLAAGLVPAIALAAGLAIGLRAFAVRVLLVAAIILLVVGLVSTESRGGLLAALLAIPAALVVFKHHRQWVVAGVAIAVGVAAMWFSASPEAWHRVTSFDNGGNGRAALWKVAWRMTGDHPVAGVGLANFKFESGKYIREPGELKRVTLVVEKPKVAHNAYLQLLSEEGVIGLALFLLVALGCLAAARRAAKRFDGQGDEQLATLSRAVLVGIVASLGASIFLSNAYDRRTWMLFALAVVLVRVATLRPRPRAASA